LPFGVPFWDDEEEEEEVVELAGLRWRRWRVEAGALVLTAGLADAAPAAGAGLVPAKAAVAAVRERSRRAEERVLDVIAVLLSRGCGARRPPSQDVPYDSLPLEKMKARP
jgi:hypothetical protein